MSKHRRKKKANYVSWETFFSPKHSEEALRLALKEVGITADRAWVPFNPASAHWFIPFQKRVGKKIKLEFRDYLDGSYFGVFSDNSVFYIEDNEAHWHKYSQPIYNDLLQKFLKKYHIK